MYDGEETAVRLIPYVGCRVGIPYILSDTRCILGVQTSVVALRNARKVCAKIYIRGELSIHVPAGDNEHSSIGLTCSPTFYVSITPQEFGT
jgi:hypothetical protein